MSKRKSLAKKLSIEKSAFYGTIDEMLNNNKEEQIDDNISMDYLIYGYDIKVVESAINNKVKNKIVYICDNNKEQLIIQQKGDKNIIRINIDQITSIGFDSTPFKNKNNQIIDNKKDNYTTIIVGKDTFNLLFENNLKLKMFLTAVMNLKLESMNIGNSAAENEENKIKKIWYNYDTDHSGKIDKEEFSKFLKEINFKAPNKMTIDDLYNAIDTDKSGFIEFNEFIEFYHTLFGGKELDSFFNKYSTNNKMTYNDLSRFYKEFQNEEYTPYELIELITQFNTQINTNIKDSILAKLKDKNNDTITNNKLVIDDIGLDNNELSNLYIDLEGFKLLCYDKSYSNIVSSERLLKEDDLSLPMYNYFINCSHNTYLNGHQLYGDSKVEMYSYALNIGCRLVELDCWDGSDNEPIITHGHTFTSNILFKDVLVAIKENAFKVSNFPVLLSIEMHCSNKQQDVMAEYFKTILKDLYILDFENPPNDYPSPLELQGKFILKCGRTRLFKNLNKDEMNNDDNLMQDNNDDDSDDDNTNTNNNNNTNIKNTKTIIIKDKDGVEKEIEEDINKLKKSKNNKITESMQAIVGLIGTKLKIDNLKHLCYQPWDCTTTKHSKAEDWAKKEEKRKLVIEYTRGSFFKGYPLLFDSSNLDPTKNWIMGAQIAAMNVQSFLDDWTLLNMVYFTLSKSSGYILKPDYLRNKNLSCINDQNSYKNPKKVVDITFLSGSMIHKLNINNEKEISSINITVSLIGSFEDEKHNKKHSFKKISEKYINPIFKEERVIFNIYETELSFVYVKIFNGSELLGRGVIPVVSLMNGIRTIDLYNNQCKVVDEALLLCCVNSKNIK